MLCSGSDRKPTSGLLKKRGIIIVTDELWYYVRLHQISYACIITQINA